MESNSPTVNPVLLDVPAALPLDARCVPLPRSCTTANAWLHVQSALLSRSSMESLNADPVQPIVRPVLPTLL